MRRGQRGETETEGREKWGYGWRKGGERKGGRKCGERQKDMEGEKAGLWWVKGRQDEEQRENRGGGRKRKGGKSGDMEGEKTGRGERLWLEKRRGSGG